MLGKRSQMSTLAAPSSLNKPGVLKTSSVQDVSTGKLSSVFTDTGKANSSPVLMSSLQVSSRTIFAKFVVVLVRIRLGLNLNKNNLTLFFCHIAQNKQTKTKIPQRFTNKSIKSSMVCFEFSIFIFFQYSSDWQWIVSPLKAWLCPTDLSMSGITIWLDCVSSQQF